MSNAISGSEKKHDTIRTRTLSEIEANWMEFVTEIGDYCGYSMFQVPPLDKPGLLSKFKNRFLGSTEGAHPFFLRAAGMTFHFRYVLIDANDYNGSAIVYSSHIKMEQNSDLVFHFLRTGTLPETWFYQFLLPIGYIDNIYLCKFCNII